MSTANKSLAKSLHTISVLVNVAKVFQFSDPDMAPRRAIVHAMTALGYLGAEDPHGLVEKAVVALTKDQPEPAEPVIVRYVDGKAADGTPLERTPRGQAGQPDVVSVVLAERDDPYYENRLRLMEQGL